MGVIFLALVFLAELAAWAAIGLAAYVLAGGGWRGWLAAAVAVAVAIAAWGAWAAPKADAPAWLATTVKVAVFGGAVLGLLLVGQRSWALALAVLVLVSHLGVVATRSRPA